MPLSIAKKGCVFASFSPLNLRGPLTFVLFPFQVEEGVDDGGIEEDTEKYNSH